MIVAMNEKSTIFKRSAKAKEAQERKLSLTFKNRSIFLPKKFLIGRDENCNISLPKDTLVSRRHAMIEFSQGEYTIKDLASLNGTFVNNKPLQKGEKRILFPGDVILIGKTVITVSDFTPG
jgi:pSer/pThr/pTyr-binding forkhead associated (FHA) protein